MAFFDCQSGGTDFHTSLVTRYASQSLWLYKTNLDEYQTLRVARGSSSTSNLILEQSNGTTQTISSFPFEVDISSITNRTHIAFYIPSNTSSVQIYDIYLLK